MSESTTHMHKLLTAEEHTVFLAGLPADEQALVTRALQQAAAAVLGPDDAAGYLAYLTARGTAADEDDVQGFTMSCNEARLWSRVYITMADMLKAQGNIATASEFYGTASGMLMAACAV